MRLLLYIAVAANFVYPNHAAHPICPHGLSPMYNGACGVRIEKAVKSYNAARKICHDMGAFLPTVWTYSENEGLRRAAAGKTIILGVTPDECKWDDGNKVEYTNYRNSKSCSSLGSITTLDPGDGKWSLTLNPEVDIVICTVPPKFSPRCADFDHGSGAPSICYDYHEEKLAWNEAAAACARDKATLAVIHGKNRNSFIRHISVSHGAASIHIGLSSVNGRNFTWTDRTEMDFNHFARGFPLSGLGGCSNMQVRQPVGQWMNEPCDREPKPFICTRPLTNVPEDDRCPEIYLYKNGDDIFSPGYPARYSQQCDYMVIGRVGSKIRVEVIKFAVNTCCAFLTIFDGVYENTEIVTLTGEHQPTNFTSTQSSVRISWNSTERGEMLGWHLRVFNEYL